MKTLKVLSPLFFVVLFVLIFSGKVTAQKENNLLKSYKNSLTLNLTRFILNEARFGYERTFSRRHMVSVVLGFQYPTSSVSFHSVPVIFGYTPDYYRVSKGIYTGIGYNYMFGRHRSAYVSGEVYFNFNKYTDKYYHFCTGLGGDSFVALQSMQLKKTGVKILMGKKVRLVSGDKTGLDLDFFAGIGIQYREEKLTIFERKYGSCDYDYSELYPLNPPEKHLYKNWYPTFHAGLLLCLPFL